MRSPRKPFRDLIALLNNADFEVKAIGVQAKGRGIIGIIIPAIIVILIVVL